MNKNQVFGQVAALVSQGHMESERVYNAALDRALEQIGRIDPLINSFTLGHFPPHAVFRLTTLCRVTEAAPLTVSAISSASFLVEGCGEGTLTVHCNGRLYESVTLTGRFSLLRWVEALCGEKEAEVTLIFTSEGELMLSALSLYDSQVKKEVCGDTLTYSALDYASDFLSFTGEVRKNRDPNAKAREVILSDSTVRVGAAYRGIYEIFYYTSPQKAEDLAGEEEFCVKKDLEHLIPLLTAYYVCLEDDNEKGEAFLSAYREALEQYRRTRRREDEFVRDVYGW